MLTIKKKLEDLQFILLFHSILLLFTYSKSRNNVLLDSFFSQENLTLFSEPAELPRDT